MLEPGDVWGSWAQVLLDLSEQLPVTEADEDGVGQGLDLEGWDGLAGDGELHDGESFTVEHDRRKSACRASRPATML
jgi:hypothetical protein